MKLAALALVLAACGAAPAEKLRDPRPLAKPMLATVPAVATATPVTSIDHRATETGSPELLVVPRPDIPLDVRVGALREAMDVSEHLRWPLTANHHPTLEPAYPIARVFAAPGVGWADLCKLGAQNRRTSGVPLDQIEYLRAWCEVARHEPESAVLRLAPLMRSGVTAMPTAVRRDIANIIVDSGDAEHGQYTLSRAHIDEVALSDLISASYEEVGKTVDAMVFNDLAVDAYAVAKVGDHCRRLAKRVVIAADKDERKAHLGMLDTFSDTTCRRLHHELACWSGGVCVPYMADLGIDEDRATVVDAYVRWPVEGATASSWFFLATELAALVPAPGADILATSALEAAVIGLECEGSRVETVSSNAHDIRFKPHDKKLDPRLDVMIVDPKKLCRNKP